MLRKKFGFELGTLYILPFLPYHYQIITRAPKTRTKTEAEKTSGDKTSAKGWTLWI